MEKTFDVIGVEDLIMDFALQIARIPKTDGMALIEDRCWAGGGNASSAIVALARLGARCAMVGTTGNDAYGAFCRADMEKNGVDVSHVKQVEGETTLCVCLAERETQGRSFLGRAGVAGEMTAEDVDEQLIANARVVHLSCSRCTGQEAAVKFAKKHGVEVSLDAALLTPATKELADQSDILIMSEQFYEGLFGNDENYQENCRKLVGQGTKIAVVTLGKKGCAGADGTKTFRMEAFSEGYPIVDTTGAGDVYHGGFLYAYLYRYRREPWNYDVEDCARFASAVSYINCTTLGGRPGIPNLSMVDTFLKEGVIPEGDIPRRKAMYRNGVFQ